MTLTELINKLTDDSHVATWDHEEAVKLLTDVRTLFDHAMRDFRTMGDYPDNICDLCEAICKDNHIKQCNCFRWRHELDAKDLLYGRNSNA